MCKSFTWTCIGVKVSKCYKRRDPFASPLWILFERHFPEFVRVYEERYESVYGFFRPVIREAVNRFLKCGDLREGLLQKETKKTKAEKILSYLCSLMFKIRLARSRWAALIKKVYEVDPLVCPHCGEQMRIVALIDKRNQADVIEKILKHCNLWRDPAKRAPPEFVLEPEYIPIDEFLADF